MALNLGSNVFSGSRSRTTPVKKKEIKVMTIPASAFTAGEPDVDDVTISQDVVFASNVANILCYAPVILPQNSTVLSIKAFGTATNKNVDLLETDLSNNTSSVFSGSGATIGGSELIISKNFGAKIDNENYAYHLNCDDLDATEFITAVRIKYIENKV